MGENKQEPRMTEKKMANRRFRKTEDAICAVFMGGKRRAVGKMAERASISRSTFYYHHQSMSDVVTDHRKYIIQKYRKLMGRVLKPGARLRTVYLQMLMFILRERQVFLMFSEAGEREIFCQMVDRLRKKVERTTRTTESAERVFELYRAEMITVLEGWGRNGFLEKEVGQTLKNMMVVTEEFSGKFSGKIK